MQKVQERTGVVIRQGETLSPREPIFDQHISLIANLPSSVWLLPLGVFAVGLRFNEAITEYVNLVFGLVLNIINSILGM